MNVKVTLTESDRERDINRDSYSNSNSYRVS